MTDSIWHYGVKGMKWGVRRSQEQLDRAAGRKVARQERRDTRSKARAARKKKASRYTKSQKAMDAQVYGEKAVKKFERVSAKGKSVRAAKVRHLSSRALASTALGTLASIATVAYMEPDLINHHVSKIVNDKKAKNAAAAGAKKAADIMADKGLTNYSTIVAQFNSETGIWE